MKNAFHLIIILIIIVGIIAATILINEWKNQQNKPELKESLAAILEQGDINGTPPQYHNRCLFTLEKDYPTKNEKLDYVENYPISVKVRNLTKKFTIENDCNESYLWYTPHGSCDICYWSVPEIIGFDVPVGWIIEDGDKVIVQIYHLTTNKKVFEDYFIFEAKP